MEAVVIIVAVPLTGWVACGGRDGQVWGMLTSPQPNARVAVLAGRSLAARATDSEGSSDEAPHAWDRLCPSPKLSSGLYRQRHHRLHDPSGELFQLFQFSTSQAHTTGSRVAPGNRFEILLVAGLAPCRWLSYISDDACLWLTSLNPPRCLIHSFAPQKTSHVAFFALELTAC